MVVSHLLYLPTPVLGKRLIPLEPLFPTGAALTALYD